MGIARFSCPPELVTALAVAGGIDVAIETGTFKAEGTLILRSAVSQVWTIELAEDLYERAVGLYGRRPGITFLNGSSDSVLAELARTIDEPAIFWLDAHGGMTRQLTHDVFNPAGEGTQCPVLGELRAIQAFKRSKESCILIDDARGFLGPLPTHRPGDWPTLLEVIDLLRSDHERYITVLDDVLIAVPAELRPTIEAWWLQQLSDRDGRDAYEQTLWNAYNPTPMVAIRRLLKSVVPLEVRRKYERHR